MLIGRWACSGECTGGGPVPRASSIGGKGGEAEAEVGAVEGGGDVADDFELAGEGAGLGLGGAEGGFGFVPGAGDVGGVEDAESRYFCIPLMVSSASRKVATTASKSGGGERNMGSMAA